mgnify:CR=1 FL=1
MYANQEKATLIAELNGVKDSPMCKSLISLLSLLTQEARVANDTAASPEFLSNQGKIGAYLELKGISLKWNPGLSR